MTGKELLYTIYQKLENYTTNLNDTYNDLVENNLNCELEFSANEIMNEKQNVLELMYQFPKLEKALEKLTKYKRAFEILKEIFDIRFEKDAFGDCWIKIFPTTYDDRHILGEPTKEQYELLEELMNDEEKKW